MLCACRAFGGVAGWDGQGSPVEETDESITHQVVDRPTQGHRFLARSYVQPQVGGLMVVRGCSWAEGWTGGGLTGGPGCLHVVQS
jgi:hypothetical protein